MPAIPVPRPSAFNEHQWLPWSEVFTDILETRLDTLARIREALEAHVERELRSVERRWAELRADKTIEHEEGQMRAELLGDERWELENVDRQGKLIQCVSMYHAVERHLGALFKFRYNAVPVTDRRKLLKRVHRWPLLRHDTQRYFDVALSAVRRYRTVNRLRCIANSVKHNDGNVNAELADVARWKLDRPINVASLDFADFRSACLTFLEDFAQRSERGMRRLLGRPR